MIFARFKDEVGMVTRNRGLVDLENVVRESADRHLLLAKVEVDPIIFRGKNLNLGHGGRYDFSLALLTSLANSGKK